MCVLRVLCLYRNLATDGPSTPFEFVALYAMLDYVCPRLQTRFHKLERQVRVVLGF
jgi:hypothetical protein